VKLYDTDPKRHPCTINFKAIRNYGLGFMIAVKSNPKISIDKGTWQ
jgi:hypothetical protein